MSNHFKKIALLLIGILSIGIAHAQVTITGNVKDAAGALIGVDVSIKNAAIGTTTNVEGNYELKNVPVDATLIFSYIGYKTQEIPLSGRIVLDVVLIEKTEDLKEVVVIGYGAQLRENISGSVSTVNAEELKEIPQVSIDQMLQGRAAGVNVTSNSGQPGSAISVKIRGITSITGSNEPLYIIDGVPVSGDAGNISTSGSSAVSAPGSGDGELGVSPLATLNPADIESIHILKDASATAIYGSRGANGVVIITTKKGKQGEGKISYSTNVALQEPAKLVQMMELQEFAVLQNRLSTIKETPSRIQYIQPELLGSGTNWQKEIFKRALMHNHQLNYSGANEKTNYYISAGYLEQEGIVLGSGFNRMSLRTNITTDVKSWLKVGTNLNISRTNDQITFKNGGFNGVLSSALLQVPDIAVYNPDGTFAGPPLDEDDFGLINPVAQALSITNTLRRSQMRGNVFSEISFTKDLVFRTEIGGDINYNEAHRFTPSYRWGRNINPPSQAELNTTNSNATFWILKNFLTYNKIINNEHSLNVMVGHEAQEASWIGTFSKVTDFITNDIQTVNVGNHVNDVIGGYKGSSALMSYLGRAIYGYKGRYSITASMRGDRSSKFAPGNQWGYFPSLSASWSVSEESFMENVSFIKDLRVFGGYGQTGNQDIPNYQYGSSLTTVATDFGTGFYVVNAANPNLTWEASSQFNLGFTFDMFNKRLNTTIELYDKTSSNFLYQLPQPNFLIGNVQYTPGLNPPWVNLGQMNNRGIDLSLNMKLIERENLQWNSNLTLSHYQNKVQELTNGLTEIIKNTTMSDNNPITPTITLVGQAMGLYYGFKTVGLFNDPETILDQPKQFGTEFTDARGDTWFGDVQYEDVNGDGVIDNNDITIIGNPHPDFTFGWNNSFYYKNFDFTIFLQGSYGNDVMNITWLRTSLLTQTGVNQSAEAGNYWTPTNRDTDIPRLSPTGDSNNNRISDRILEDGSYIRIQNIKLGYTLPNEPLERIQIKNLKIYAAIQNLYTFSKYKGYDPEIGSLNQDVLLMGIDNGRYPTPRTFTVGLNIEF